MSGWKATRFHDFRAPYRGFLRSSSCLHRQHDTEGRASVYGGLESKRASVFLDDARGDRKAQTCAILLGGEKRIEEPLLNLHGDPRTVVLDFDGHDFAQSIGQHHPALNRSQLDCSACANGLRGVLHEIDHDLFELLTVAENLFLHDTLDNKIN